MADLSDGLIIDHSNVNSNNLTYRGKPVKFQKDEQSGTYKAEVKFSEEEQEQGYHDVVLTYQLNNPTGTVEVKQLLPDNEDFKDLTDAEKFTKMNSLSYQTGRPEPTQIADGSQVTHIGVAAKNSKAAKDDNPSDASTWHESKIRARKQEQQKKINEQQAKKAEELNNAIENPPPVSKSVEKSTSNKKSD